MEDVNGVDLLAKLNNYDKLVAENEKLKNKINELRKNYDTEFIKVICINSDYKKEQDKNKAHLEQIHNLENKCEDYKKRLCELNNTIKLLIDDNKDLREKIVKKVCEVINET